MSKDIPMDYYVKVGYGQQPKEKQTTVQVFVNDYPKGS
jgi:hypothetical protein